MAVCCLVLVVIRRRKVGACLVILIIVIVVVVVMVLMMVCVAYGVVFDGLDLWRYWYLMVWICSEYVLPDLVVSKIRTVVCGC